jgi:hypothetical protein
MMDPYGFQAGSMLGVSIDAFGKPIGGPIEHPRASTALILGVLGLACCGICAPIAWAMSRQALIDIDRSGGVVSGRAQVMVGLVLGIVGTAAMIVQAVVFTLILIGGHA